MERTPVARCSNRPGPPHGLPCHDMSIKDTKATKPEPTASQDSDRKAARRRNRTPQRIAARMPEEKPTVAKSLWRSCVSVTRTQAWIAREDAGPHPPYSIQRDQKRGGGEHPPMSKGGQQADGETDVQETSEAKCRAAHQCLGGTATLPKLTDEVSKVAEVGAQRSGNRDEREPENRAHDSAVQTQLSWGHRDQ